ncbi:MAG: redox-regulated ATPase YchF [Rhodobiaceae bacterium]|nr:redox-regulated ATPase YchF [Rhodobiaceae bacterium]
MGFKCGIIGLPNVGKSTLFNALTQTANAQAANYPFCTIEPNIGEVTVPDSRLTELSRISKSKNIIPSKINFVDIAGLVKGASKGEGLGNKFLSNIRETDAIAHVIRCFEDDDITHVEGKLDPLSDIEIIETELLLADIQNLENRATSLEKKLRSSDKDAVIIFDFIKELLDFLNNGWPARSMVVSTDLLPVYKEFNLLTSKPLLYICNVEEESTITGNILSDRVIAYGKDNQVEVVIISAAIEAEISLLAEDEKKEYLESMGLNEAGLNRLIKAGYSQLDLITYSTSGEQETRAWTIPNKTAAPKAAGAIHTDFEKGFIRAETISYDDFISFNGELGARESGKMRLEGKEYIVKDGDIMHFRFSN